MSIGLRIVVLLCCAYAGWQTASIQFEALPELRELDQESSSRSP
jgi:hypothetical protein